MFDILSRIGDFHSFIDLHLVSPSMNRKAQPAPDPNAVRN
jgi:hypothetical protein